MSYRDERATQVVDCGDCGKVYNEFVNNHCPFCAVGDSAQEVGNSDTDGA